MKFNNSCSR